MLPIKSGKIASPQKVVIYGVEGIGKTSLAAQMPKPLFIDTEGGTQPYDVDRLEPTSWEELIEFINEILSTDGLQYKTLVIDTIDWAMSLLTNYICRTKNKQSIEDFAFGAGYKFIYEELERLMKSLTAIRNNGMHVVLVAHSKLVKFELPEESGTYDKYELKLDRNSSKASSQIIKEWADMLLFCNYQTETYATDANGKKYKAAGGKKRVMYTTHTAVWDAKNRYNLPDKLPLSYEPIAFIFDQSFERTVEVNDKKPTIDSRLKKLMDSNGIREDEIQDALSQTMQINIPPAEYELDLVDYIIQNWADLMEYMQSHECGLPY